MITQNSHSIASYGGTLAESFGSSHLIYARIFIEGEEILKNSSFELSLREKYASHSEFSIVCPSGAFGDGKNFPMTNSKKYFARKILIEFYQFGKAAHRFVGLVTNISSRRRQGSSFIEISGNSPTILLENGLDCQSYEEKTLTEIIKEATKEYPSDVVKLKVNPMTKQALPYTVQYRESDWDFLQRLAQRHGEWLLYDGENIVFGESGGKIFELFEGKNMEEFTLKMQAKPQRFKYLSYDSKYASANTLRPEQIGESIHSQNSLQQYAIKASRGFFTKEPVNLYNQTLDGSLREAVRKQKFARENTMFLEAKTSMPKLTTGDAIRLNQLVLAEGGAKYAGAYRITEIAHHYTPSEGYTNELKGVPDEILVPEYIDEDRFPQCEEQSATVTDNNDPEGMSRIRVQFVWQKDQNLQTPWLRVATPYAGSGKGMHVLPEIGEEVIVGFENGNAEKPFIIGAMFNGKAKSGKGGSGNYMKGLQTASGNKILFNDKDGSTELTDHKNTNLKFDGKGNTTLGTTSSFNVAVGLVSDTATDGQASLKMDKDGNINLEGKTMITLKVGSSTVVIDGNGITLTSGTDSISINPSGMTGNICAISPGINVKASKNVIINGGENITIDSQKTMTIKGTPKVKIN